VKLYYFPFAPNPTRVLVYVREKGIDMEFELVSLLEEQQNSPEHLARNPAGTLPVLELDSGEYLCESVPIMEYLEELHPQPVMIGCDPGARARTRAFERMAEMCVLQPIARIVHATRSPLGLPAKPEVAEEESQRLPVGLERIDARIGDSPFAAGDSPTIVDCTLFAGLRFGEAFGVEVTGDYPNLQRWYSAFGQRPSCVLDFPA
jgi:glutathione S-transferase